MEDELELEKEELSKDKRMNWADSFFIYDYYRYNTLFEKKTKEKTKQEIILLLSEYHYLEYVEEYHDNGRAKKTRKITWDNFWKEHVEEEFNDYKELHEEEMEINIRDFPNIKAYIDEGTIRNRIDKMEEYICGEAPKYKILIDS